MTPDSTPSKEPAESDGGESLKRIVVSVGTLEVHNRSYGVDEEVTITVEVDGEKQELVK